MHGLSTLNRLLGKKNKEVSRSTSNLSKSHNNLDSSSQHKKISPIFNNPPFEQSFRVTVYLPRNQLYVERIGAKTKLEKLMNDVCDSKSLSPDKYEFRHPVDISQVFNKDQTIGEVGLNELRLVLKTESRFNGDFHRFHSDDMLKYRSSHVPESVSSSEISRNLQNVSKTSPYSSTNSLNSLDSTGMNSTGKTTTTGTSQMTAQQPPVAPIRKKKRMAPRPPSENSIPEQEIFSSTTLNVFKEPHSILPRKNFHVSSPQLYNASNNHNMEIMKKSDSNNNHTEMRPISSRLNAITRPSSMFASPTATAAPAADNCTTSEVVRTMPERQRNNSESSEIQSILKDSAIVDSKHSSLERPKKKSPAPVPPSRSRAASKPTPSPRTIQDDMKQQSITEIKEVDEHENVAGTAQKQQVAMEIPKDNYYSAKGEDSNVSKVLLNNSGGAAADGPSSIEATDGSISIQIISKETTKTITTAAAGLSETHERRQQETREIESAKLPVASKVIHVSRRADAGNDDETRSTEGEEEEMTVNIYNVTKSCVVTCEKPAVVRETKTVSVVEEKHVIVENNNVVKEETKTVIQEERQRSPSPQWTYQLPAPPIVLSDATTIPSNNNIVAVAGGGAAAATSSPTDCHKSVDGVNGKFFADYSSTLDNETVLSDSNTTTLSAETHIQPVINERRKTLEDSFVVVSSSTIAVKPELDDSIVDSDKSATEIITSDLEDGYLGNCAGNGTTVSVIESFASTPSETNCGVEKEIIVEDFQRSRLIITRSDSFHSIGQQKKSDYDSRRTTLSALPQRSTSFLSLNHSHKAELSSSKVMNAENVPYNRQKSTSELSISDVPSLQSLEVLKNILNSSRKNSLQDTITTSSSSNNNLVKDSKGEKEKVATTAVNSEEIAMPKNQPVLQQLPKDEVKSTERAYVEELKERYTKKLETQKSEPSPMESFKRVETSSSSTSSSSQWRYSGPPKINFSTWSERPKVEVSVMSDEDYIFGGNTSTSQRDSVARNRQMFEQKSETVVFRRENSKKESAEKHLPKVLHVEYKKEVNPVELRKSSNFSSSSSLSTSEITSSSSSNNNLKTVNGSTKINIKPRPMSMDYSSSGSSNGNNSYHNSSSQSVSYNRLSGNHKKFTPIVHGFAKLDNISETQPDVKSPPLANKIVSDASEKRAEAPIIPLKPTYLRSTSAGDINRNKMKLTPVAVAESASNDSYEESAFSQTLRRTGLIEKRLNDDRKTVSMFGRVIDSPKSQAAANSTVHNNNNNNNISNSIHYQVPVEEKRVTIRQHSLPATPPMPPPPMPNSGGAVAFRKSAPAGEMDTRNELLDAIKNFNKDSLRRK